RWRLAPRGQAVAVRRSYRPDTLVLDTEGETTCGAGTSIDFMPARGDQCNLVRLVRGVRGKVAMEMDLVLRFDYGASVPWVTRMHDGLALRAVAGPDMVVLRTPVRLEGQALATVSRFEVSAGETLPFVLSHRSSHLEP